MILRQGIWRDIAGMERVRQSTIVDPHAITRVSRSAYQLLLGKAGRGWVIEERGDVIAFVICNRKNANIWALYVDPLYQRQGLGKELLGQAVDWLWQSDWDMIWLMSDNNRAAQDFYIDQGWCKTGEYGRGQAIFELSRTQDICMSQPLPMYAAR